MNPSLYRSAMEGHVDVLSQHTDVLDGERCELTKNRNNVLHVASQFGHLKYVRDVLQVCPSLLRKPNIKGETPLHMASREGQSEILEAMIVHAKKLEEELESGWRGALKEILRAPNVNGDTALHMAARNCHLEEVEYLEVVKLLTNEDPAFEHPPNNVQETPLYLAAERGKKGVAIVDTLLKTCRSLTCSGPGGRTALHAATLKDSTGQSTKKLLEWKNDLINLPDKYGRIPLHYASCNGNKEAVKELLAFDNSGVYISTTTHNDGRDTALHIAAAHGHVPVIEELLSCNPDCWEMVNSKGQNILHIAVDMNMELVIKFIVNQPWFRHLINQKDNEGNTPLHLLIASDCNVDALWKHGKADQYAFNDKSMTPVDLVWSNFKEEKMSTFATTYIVDDTFLASGISGGRTVDCNAHDNLAKLERARKKRLLTKVAETDKQKKAKDKDTNERFQRSMSLFQTLVIVAALITTITFTAAFTIPGGYYGDKGGDKEAAFTAFFITNTIAMVCSVTSILLCFYAMFHVIAGNDADSGGVYLYSIALVLILVSIFVLVLAFISATFAVLARSKELVVATCIITVIPFTALFFKIIKTCF